MDDFLPRGASPSLGSTPLQACLLQRASYDVMAASGSEGVMFVSIFLSPGACLMTGPVLDAGALYAVDVRAWRVLAIQR